MLLIDDNSYNNNAHSTIQTADWQAISWRSWGRGYKILPFDIHRNKLSDLAGGAELWDASWLSIYANYLI